MLQLKPAQPVDLTLVPRSILRRFSPHFRYLSTYLLQLEIAKTAVKKYNIWIDAKKKLVCFAASGIF